MPILRYTSWPAFWHIFLPSIMLMLIVLLQPWLEASMGRHMVLELPLLFVCGWWFAHALRPHGKITDNVGARPTPLAITLPALLTALLISSFWMLPIALDNAVLIPRYNLMKFLSLLLAGFLTGLCWRRAGVILQGFFIVNWAWMTITAGMLYQTAPQQLCSVYLDEQQQSAGTGLVLLASLTLGVWLLMALLKLTREEAMQEESMLEKSAQKTNCASHLAQ